MTWEAAVCRTPIHLGEVIVPYKTRYKEGAFLCPLCENSMSRLGPPYCQICAHPAPSGKLCGECAAAPPAIDGIRAPYLMEGALREGIHALKYRNLRAATPTLGGLLGRWLQSSRIPGELLVPVPLHKRRMRDRGYNQSALLAKEVANRTGLPVAQDVLVRTKDTPPQVSLSHTERVRNVEGSFACVGNVRGKRIILVDDVVTTGSTMSACGTSLRAGGASSVWGVALAREGHRTNQ